MKNLTSEETKILNLLADAWNVWCQLDNRDDQDDAEFCTVIHAAQSRIALRVARRVDPELWRQP